jgi:hypothetical protein
MTERARVTTSHGLRLRDSPRDGTVLDIIPQHTEVEVLGRETWLRVNYGGTVGFVLADYVEPEEASSSPTDSVVQIMDITHRALKGEVLRADVDFAAKVRALADSADASGIAVWVTSSLREPYKPVPNAVVNPATFSNHHVGHAFDMNIVFDNTLYRSSDMASGKLPNQVQSFLNQELPKFDLTWGGTLNPKDFVHIDDRLNERDIDSFRAKLAALWGAPP